MLKAFKYRLYPNKEQEILLAKHFGACRFIYNLALETKSAAYSSARVNLSRYDLQVQMKELKQECVWLKEINSQALSSELMHLDAAYLKFFKGKAKFPKFKNRYDRQSFQCPQRVKVKDGKIWLPKFKTGIKIVLSRSFDGEMRTVTISKTKTGKHFASILIQDNQQIPEKAAIEPETAVGIDLGLTKFATLSDGREIDNPRHLKKSFDRLKVLQRRASKKQKGSKNRQKANKRLAKLHEKITNQRKDFLHKFSNDITNGFDTILVENLNIEGMRQNHKLAQSVSDVGWSTGLDFIKYKSEWKGKTYHEIGRFDPSSKIHNKCGYRNNDLTLADRTWVCPKCGETVDRDINAALNIKQFGLSYLGVGNPVEPAELPTLVGALKQEA